MDEKMKKMLQDDAERDADAIWEEANEDTIAQKAIILGEVHENLLVMIRAYEEERAIEKLSDETKEFIQLGKVYKKRKKWNKVYVLVAILVFTMSLGITSVGGPEKVLERFQVMMNGKQQVIIESESDRVGDVEIPTEAEAFEMVEEKYGFYPVKMYNMPDGVSYKECCILDDVQVIDFYYEGLNKEVVVYEMFLDYQLGSMGMDREEKSIQIHRKSVEGTEILVTYYKIEENIENYWKIEFEYKDIYYFIEASNVEEKDIRLMVENLYFS